MVHVQDAYNQRTKFSMHIRLYKIGDFPKYKTYSDCLALANQSPQNTFIMLT